VLALVLAVPLSVAGNLLTPAVKNWWAEGSVRRARRRVRDLRAQLAYLESLAGDHEYFELVALRAVLRGVGWGVLGLAVMGYGIAGLVDSVGAVGSSEAGRRAGWIFVMVGSGMAEFIAWRSIFSSWLVGRVDNVDVVRKRYEAGITKLVRRFGPEVDDCSGGAQRDGARSTDLLSQRWAARRRVDGVAQRVVSVGPGASHPVPVRGLAG
jgi:hypothetical protein